MSSQELKHSKRTLMLEKCCSIFEASSIHGIPNIVRSQSKWSTWMWILCLIVSSSWCAFIIIKSVNDYASNKVVTNMHLRYRNKLNFPVVTICNVNPFTTAFARQQIEFIFDPKLGKIGPDRMVIAL
jgi:hypothetical protein